MNAPLVLLLCCVVGSAVGYYEQRNAPYNIGPNDPYSVAVNPNFIQEPSQRLFWNKFGNNGQGNNQVGGTGLWAMFTNKFPFLGNMFGRMELPAQYGPPGQYNSNQYDTYGAPAFQAQPQYNQLPQQYNQIPQQYNQNSQQYNQIPQQYNQIPQQYNQVPPQFYQAQQFRQQQFARNLSPSGRDVAITDDAVIVTPPFVPIAQPAPAPAPAPEPAPGGGGYQYSKPQHRLELPHK